MDHRNTTQYDSNAQHTTAVRAGDTDEALHAPLTPLARPSAAGDPSFLPLTGNTIVKSRVLMSYKLLNWSWSNTLSFVPPQAQHPILTTVDARRPTPPSQGALNPASLHTPTPCHAGVLLAPRQPPPAPRQLPCRGLYTSPVPQSVQHPLHDASTSAHNPTLLRTRVLPHLVTSCLHPPPPRPPSLPPPPPQRQQRTWWRWLRAC